MSWYVIRTHRHAERRAIESVKGAVVRAYLPIEKRLRRVRHARVDRHRVVTTPVIPGYVFVLVRKVEDLAGMRDLEGVVGVMGNGTGDPIAIDAKEVRRLRVAEAAGAWDNTRGYAPRVFGKGQAVRIRRGPFLGFRAKYLSSKPKERVEVLLQSMRKGSSEYPMVLDLEDIEPVDERVPATA